VSDAWLEALDALEARLDRQRAFVHGVGPLPEGEWEAPAEPLPATLRVRALTLVSACDEIEAQLGRMMADRQEPIVSPYR
jgi:hypothetical protein